jgi:hypothetical protein
MINELGDEVMAPPIPRGPVAPSGSVNELGDPIMESPHNGNIIQGASTPPDAAAKSIDIASKSGVPASLVHLNPEHYERKYNVDQGVAAAHSNPYLQTYINTFPLASSVSQDDWPALDKASKALQELHPGSLTKQAEAGLLLKTPEITALADIAAGRRQFLDVVQDKLFSGDFRKRLLMSGAATLSPLDIAISKLSEWYGKGISAATGGLIPPEEAEKSLMGLGGGKAPVAMPGKAATDVEGFLSTLRGLKTRGEIEEFLQRRARGETFDNKTGAWSGTPDPLAQDQLKIEYANNSAAKLQEAIETTAETKTAGRSQPALDAWAAAHEEHGTVHIPGSKILEVYQAAGKIPMVGDGLFGFVPGLTQKMETAAELGTEISIPKNKYIANMANHPEVHDQVAEVLRVDPKGTTLEEAKELSTKQPEEQSSERIDGSAVQVNGKLYAGIIHPDAMEAAAKELGTTSEILSEAAQRQHDYPRYQLAPGEHQVQEGFITTTNRFVTRAEASEIATREGQIKEGMRDVKDRFEQSWLTSEAMKESASLGTAKPELFTAPFIKDAKTLGVTETDLKNYANLVDRANETKLTKAVAFAAKEVKRRQGPEWESNKNEIRSEVESDFKSRSDLAADRFLRTGDFPSGETFQKVKLNKAEVEKIAGPGALSKYVTDDEGADLNVLATTFGFDDGPSLVRALDSLDKARKAADKGPKAHTEQLVKAETERRMEEKYGNLNENIALEASEIALAEHEVDLLSAQWRMLAKINGVEPPVQLTDLKKWSKDQFDQAEVGQVSYETFRRAAEKSANEVQKAMLKQDWKEALKQKQSQTLNVVLAKEAKAFEKEQASLDKLVDKYKSEANLPKVDQAFTDQIHGLLQMYDVGLKRTRQNIDYNLAGKTWSDFVDEQNRNGSLLPKPSLPTPGAGHNGGPPLGIDDFTVSQFRDYASLLKSLDHNGRTAKQIEVAGKKEDHFQAVEKIVKSLDTLEKKDFDPDAVGAISALRRAGRYIDAKLLKMEKLIDWTDKEDPLGAMNSSVLRGLIEGEQNKGFMITKLAKMAKALPNDRAWGKALNTLADNQELHDWETGKLVKVTNENKISMALNYGNMGNRNVMLNGHHWSGTDMETFLNRTMSKMDWDVVNAIHGLFEPLGPLVEEVTRKRSGLAIPLVDATPFLGSKGGYFPLIQNPRDVLIGAKQSTDLFDKTKFDPLPMSQALKQRTGSVYRLDFSLNRLHSILAQTVHAVYLQAPVINANKVLKDPLVREGIANGFGPEYVKMADDWIRDIANNGGQDDDAMTSWISRNLRENVTTMLMGYKFSTALIHGGSAGAASLYELGKMHLEDKGPKSFVLAPAELIKNIKALGLDQFLPEEARRFFSSSSNVLSTYEEVMSKSRELPNRQRALQKDFGFQLNKLVNKNMMDDVAQLRAYHQAYAMSMVGYLDLLTATPVWKAAEAKALLDGHEPDDAIYIADKAVREAHGSASLISRANVGRGEFNKWMTIAYNGYWNHNYNKSREVTNILTGRVGGAEPPPPPGFDTGPNFGGEDGGSGPDPKYTRNMKFALAAGFATAMLVAPALVHHAVRGDEAETTEGAILAMMASQLGGQIPVVNTLMYSLIHNRDPSVSPVENVLRAVVNVGRDVKKLVNGDDPSRPWTHGAQAIGYLTGLPPTQQFIDGLNFMNDVANDDQNPESVGEWANGILTGHARPRR